jgi:hypothetical protein
MSEEVMNKFPHGRRLTKDDIGKYVWRVRPFVLSNGLIDLSEFQEIGIKLEAVGDDFYEFPGDYRVSGERL